MSDRDRPRRHPRLASRRIPHQEWQVFDVRVTVECVSLGDAIREALTTIEELGWEIFSVLPVTETHAVIVVRCLLGRKRRAA